MMLGLITMVIKLKQVTQIRWLSQVFQRWEYREIGKDEDDVKNLDSSPQGRLYKIWGRHFIEVWSSPDAKCRRRLEEAASTNKCWEYKLPSRAPAATPVKAFHILEDFLFNPNMFRMSVSTGQLDIGPVDAEFISDNNKRKSKKKRFFPNPAQLLSRYSGKRNYRV